MVTLVIIVPTPRGVSIHAPLLLCPESMISKVSRTGISITQILGQRFFSLLLVFARALFIFYILLISFTKQFIIGPDILFSGFFQTYQNWACQSLIRILVELTKSGMTTFSHNSFRSVFASMAATHLTLLS